MNDDDMDKTRSMADVVTAAQEWVEAIHSHPHQWADQPDFNLIHAVRTHIPGVRCRWLEESAYAGWPDSTAPHSGPSCPGCGKPLPWGEAMPPGHENCLPDIAQTPRSES